jgi:hypothetical protein
MIAEVDKDGDGQLNIGEFVTMMTGARKDAAGADGAVDIEDTAETNKAAAKIQAVHRGRHDRKAVEEKKKAAKEGDKPAGAEEAAGDDGKAAGTSGDAKADGAVDIEDTEETNKAAARIKAVHRGRHDRKVVDEKKKVAAAKDGEAPADDTAAKPDADAGTKNDADAAPATEEKKDDGAVDIEDTAETNKAAAKIQAVHRGNRDRKAVEEKKTSTADSDGKPAPTEAPAE